MYDAVIIGSGPNGLAAAITLAQAGKWVKVIEGHDTIGGGTRTEHLIQPDVLHDVCSAVHPLGIGSPFLSTLDLHLHGLEWAHPPIPFAHALDGGDAVFVHRSLQDTMTDLGVDGEVWGSIFGPAVEDWKRTVRLATGPPLRAARTPVTGLRLARHGLRSGTHMASRFATDRGRAVVSGLAAHAVAPLDTPTAGGVALLLGAAAHAVGWPFARGGSASITSALGALLESLGGEIETGRWVRRMADIPDTRAIIFDTSPQAALSIAGERMTSGTRRRYRNQRQSPGSFKLDIVTDGPIPWENASLGSAGTVHLGGTFEEVAEAEAKVAAGEIPERPFVLLTQPMVADESRAPSGTGVVWAYCHVPVGSQEDMTQRIIGQIDRFAPGFSTQIRAMSIRGPSDLEADNPNYIGGDITGGPISLRGVLARPKLFRPYRAGDATYLCSASTPPGAGVHGMCGHHAAVAVLKDL
jgi:phytoene dehydrogenase-like protein